MGIQLKRRYLDARRSLKIMLDLRRRKRLIGTKPVLEGEDIVVSLTSYPPRYPSLHLVIESLLGQTLLPNRVVLYIARSQRATLPTRLTRMQDGRFEIKFVDDLKSYKKLLPALDDFSTSTIVIVDDDVIYPVDLLHDLVATGRAYPGSVVCGRAHRLRTNVDGTLLPYRSWEFDVSDAAAKRPSTNIMPTGMGGVLYPPGSMVDRVRDIEEAMRLCPQGDDIWFFWMARLNGTRIVRIDQTFTPLHPTGSQDEALWHNNLTGGGNDPQIQSINAIYPLPMA